MTVRHYACDDLKSVRIGRARVKEKINHGVKQNLRTPATYSAEGGRRTTWLAQTSCGRLRDPAVSGPGVEEKRSVLALSAVRDPTGVNWVTGAMARTVG